MDINVRQIVPEDAAGFISLKEQIYRETPFFWYEPNEQQISVLEQRKKILSSLQQKNPVIFIAEMKCQLIGFLLIKKNQQRRKAHSAYVVTGLIQKYTNIGIGQKFFTELGKWALQNLITRLELNVSEDNVKAIHFYKKQGFYIEGKKANSLFRDGHFITEYLMAKIIDNQ